MIVKKLNNLYKGKIMLPNCENNFINLSNILTKHHEEFLNLGLNCHIQQKFDIIDMKVEMKILFDSLLKVAKNNNDDRSPDDRSNLDV